VAEHVPVLVTAVVEAFGALEPGALVVDGTCGFGGHCAALLERYPQMRVVGLDCDEQAVEAAAGRLRGYGGRAVVRHHRFSRWDEQLKALGLGPAQGLLLDLGVSSMQLDRAERGFSFRGAGPIDMRMDPSQGQSAMEFLAGAPEDEIARVIFTYGEERLSRRIAREIKRAISEGRLSTTSDLAAVCRRAYPPGPHRIDPATRTFQALRIHVNDELGELQRALSRVPAAFAGKGIVAVISFHSLEDRIVKQTFREWHAQGRGRILKPAPRTADQAERDQNPRARSAKMRVFAWGEAPGGREGPDRYRSKRHR
jgi:16S rRNA (cytosine1402-N4)-methyltransferase